MVKIAKQFSLLDITIHILGIIYLKRHFVILTAIVSLIIGFILSKKQGFKYKASTTFVVNENLENQDGSPGEAYYGENLFELIKSYDVIKSALLSPIVVDSKNTNLASYLMKHDYLQNIKVLDKEHFFDNTTDKRLTNEEELIMKNLHQKLTSFENFKIGITERGQILPSIDVYSSDEFFAANFSQNLIKEINRSYNLEKSTRINTYLNNLLFSKYSLETDMDIFLEKELSADIFMLNEVESKNLSSITYFKNEVINDYQLLTKINSDLLHINTSMGKQVDLIEVVDAPKYLLPRVAPPFIKYVVTFFIFFLISIIFFYAIFMKE